ncbi:MAG: HDOD domain-containing protein [Proteobacteria bacterium]|nr:HDOD domain-containing protein [Pseudomonadota bacterium]
MSISALSKVIENDQAIVTKILQLVNSSFYPFRSKIESIPRAVVVLGLNTIRNAVLSVSLMEAFRSKDDLEQFDIEEFWHHSIAIAATSKHLAEKTRLEIPDDCFVAGLLHDIGKVILAQYFKGQFTRILELIRTEHVTFYEAEQRLLPVNHAEIGGYLAGKWDLPDSLVHAIKYHHWTSDSAANLNLSMIVRMAKLMANQCTAESDFELDYSHIDPSALDIVKNSLETASDWLPEVNEEIESIREFLLEGKAAKIS